MAQAYSYIRFSSEKQQLGDSLRRQLKLAEDYAAEHKLNLDTHSYRDLGVSAFHGKNALEGRLGTFWRAVEEGIIKSGSYLLVESLDRLSRNEVDEALELFLQIIRKGIIIVTLSDRQEYSRARIKSDHGISLIVSIIYMSRAHEESATKSSRVKAAWESKRKEAANTQKIMSAMAPAWLKPNADRTKWIVDKRKAATVREIFSLALNGNGTPTIARLLNEKKTPTMQTAAHWSFGTVSAILKNPAVIGKLSPKKTGGEPITSYYPSIVSETQFHLVQEALGKRRWIGGRNTENVLNLFAGYCFCEECGSKMRSVGSSKTIKQDGQTVTHVYLQCLSSYQNSGCDEGRFPYLAVEKTILIFLAQELSELLVKGNNKNQVDPAVLLRARCEDLKAQREKLLNLALSMANPSALAGRINANQTEITEIEKKLLEPTPHVLDEEDAASFTEMVDSMLGWKGPLDRPLRLRVQTELRRIIDKLSFAIDGGQGQPTVRMDFTPQLNSPPTTLDVSPNMQVVGGSKRKNIV